MKELPFAEATSCYLVSQVPEITHAERHLPLQMLVLIKRNSKTFTGIGNRYQKIHQKPLNVKITALSEEVPNARKLSLCADPEPNNCSHIILGLAQHFFYP